MHADRPLTCALIAEVEYGLIVETCIKRAPPVSRASCLTLRNRTLFMNIPHKLLGLTVAAILSSCVPGCSQRQTDASARE